MKGKGKKIKENERKRREIKEKVKERKDNPRVFAEILEEDSVDAFTVNVIWTACHSQDRCRIAMDIRRCDKEKTRK